MAKNITIAGASYNDVASVQLNLTGGGTALFPDTSDANATAADILAPKTAYVNGVKVTGTGTGGGGELEEKDVNFYDYDGTLLHSWTLSEMQAATIMPPLATHSGLTCQGWNWTLAQLKAENRKMNVGLNYITDDENTRFYLNIGENKTVTLYWYQNMANSVLIDWGDGTIKQSVSARENVNLSHTYSSSGKYVVKFEKASTTSNYYFGYNTTNGVFGVLDGYNSYIKTGVLWKVELGAIKRMSPGAFSYCINLKTITMPNGIGYVGQQWAYATSIECCIYPNTITNLIRGGLDFNASIKMVSLPKNLPVSTETSIIDSAHNIRSYTIPNGVTQLYQYTCRNCEILREFYVPDTVQKLLSGVFYMCYGLQSVHLPDTLVDIGTYCFYRCYSLSKLVFPPNLGNIQSNAFQDCKGMLIYDFSRCTKVPTLGTNVVTNITSNCVMYIPSALYNTWKSATNWNAYANYMVAV